MAITLSAGVRQNLAALQATSALQSQTQTRLATGKKVNSALDNPTNFFTASGLTNRANDLSKLLDSMGQAVKTLQAADKGIAAISKLVENAQSLANQAKSTTEGRTGAAVALKVDGSATPDDTAANAAANLTITVDGGSAVTLDLSAVSTKAQLVAAIDAQVSTIDAAIETDGSISLTHKTAGATGRSIAVGGSDAAAIFGTLSTETAGADATAAVSPDASRAKLATDFAEIRKQIDQLVNDSGYNGINLLKGDSLKVTFNEKGDSELNIAGKASDSSASGLNVRAAANSWASNTDVQGALDDLKAATNTLRSTAASFGASLSIVQNRQDFTKSMVDVLNNGSDELTNADMNQEAANMLALNTRAQLANSALSMASQQDQGILRLFG